MTGDLFLNAGVCLQLYSRLGDGPEWCTLPVRLLRLFPHHHIKGRGVLVAEDEASVVIVRYGVHVERSLKVDAAESRVSYRKHGVHVGTSS